MDNDDELDELNQKINKKFIRHVIKPMEQAHRYHSSSSVQETAYKIPSSSDVFRPPHPPNYHLAINPLRPQDYGQKPPPHHAESFQMPPLKQRTPVQDLYRYPPVSAPAPPPPPTPESLNCVVVCQHVKSCPVCSQLYKPQTGVYLAIITILVIIILFLFKKIFQF